MCCGLANFLIKVYESAADSSCYLSSWAPSPLWMKGKTPSEGKTVVTLTSRVCVLKDGKASKLPHAGSYGYDRR